MRILRDCTSAPDGTLIAWLFKLFCTEGLHNLWPLRSARFASLHTLHRHMGIFLQSILVSYIKKFN